MINNDLPMSDKTKDSEQESGGDSGERHPGHINALAFATADSLFKARLWSYAASTLSWLGFKYGLQNEKTAPFANKAAELVTLPEKTIKTFYSNISGKPLGQLNIKRDAQITAVVAISLIVEYVVAFPYFKAALKRINRINADNDAVRSENVRLKYENNQLHTCNTDIQENTEKEPSRMSGEEGTPASRVIKNNRPIGSHAEAVVQETPQEVIR